MSISCTDVDDDGDYDCLLVKTRPPQSVRYFENTGSATAPEFTQRSGAAENPFASFNLINGWYTPAPAFFPPGYGPDMTRV